MEKEIEKKLDWRKIRLQCPNAFKMLVEDHNTIDKWGEIDSPEIWDIHVVEEHFVMRHLFDFFDSKNIIITVEYFVNRKEKMVFTYDISDVNGLKGYDSLEEYADRTSCEIDAWDMAFKLLEQYLVASIVKMEERILRYPKEEYPDHLLYIKDNTHNRDFMDALWGKPEYNHFKGAYLEINFKDRTYHTTPDYQWLYRDAPPLATLQEVALKSKNSK